MRNPENLRRRGCLLLASVVILQAVVLMGLPASSGSDPDITDNFDGTKTATWGFDNPLNYTRSGVSVSGGVVELERVNEGFVDTLEADFLSARATENVSVLPTDEVQLSGNAGDLIPIGDFSSGGLWDYTSSTDITADRNASSENAFLEHRSGSVDTQFDSMDDIWSTGWTGIGVPGAFRYQDYVNFTEGNGSMRVSFDPGGNPSNWGGAERTLAGGQDWSAYNSMVLQGNTTFGGPGLVLYLNLSDGTTKQNLPGYEMTTGWKEYQFSLQDFSGDLTSITDVRVLVTNVTVPILFYADNISLTFHKSFDQTAYINQTFTKPAQTSGQLGGVVLTFDYRVESNSNFDLFNVSVRVNNTITGFLWYKIFTSTAFWTPMYFDLSSNMTDSGTYQISLSLNIIVNTSNACSALVRFDNVSITWLDYHDGWLESRIFDAGSHTIWENISWVEGPPDPAYNTSLRTRTGNNDTPDPSWSPWSAPLWNPAGELILSPSSRYIQYNVSLTTTNGSLSPNLSEVRIGGWHYSSGGYIQTGDFVPAEALLGWRAFNASDSIPPSCDVTYWYWNSSSPGWFQVVPGGDLSSLDTQSVTLRANLTTTDTVLTPQLFNISLDYEFLGAIDHIVVVPDVWNGTADETFDFNATAYDSYGHTLSVTFEWSTDPSGTISSEGLYTPHDAGNWTVTVTADGLEANATVNISPGALDRLEISPGTWSGFTNQSVDFTCEGFDNKSNSVLISPVWDTTDPLGIMGSGGTYYPGSANASGSVWTVYCNDTISSMSTSVQVTVWPGPLHTVRVSPWSLGTVTADDNITLYCYGYDFFNNFIGPTDANWSLSGSFGTISSERRSYAVFDPVLAGSVGNITARHDDNISATTDDFLIVPGALATLVIIPEEVDLKVGQKQEFLALGYDSDGNEVDISEAPITWTSNVGSVTQNELKAQTISDHGWMNVTVSGVSASAIVRVRALAPAIWDVLFFPWSVLIIVVVLAILIFAWRSIREMYAVEDVFIVGNEGRLISHRTRRLHADRDEDILAGMLTAIQEFIRDSFREGDELRRFEFGEKNIVIAKGSHIYAAAFFAGKPPKWAESTLGAFVSDFETRYEFDKKKWSGDVSALEDLDEMMALIVGVKKYKEGDWERKLK